MVGYVSASIDGINGILWNYVLIALLLGAGAWFASRFRVIQLTALFLGMKPVGSKGEPGGISLFQAFATEFAFSSVIGNYAYAEGNVEFITKRRGVLPSFHVVVLGMAMFGRAAQLPLVWAMADAGMRLMAIINLIAILALGNDVHAAWSDYCRQRAQGIADLVFTRNTIPELARLLLADVWGQHGLLPPVSVNAAIATCAAVRKS